MHDEIRRIAGVPATTATHSIFAACKNLSMKRVAVISPYSEAIDAAEHCFFAEGGIETIAGAHLDITDGFRLTEPAPESMFDLRLGAAVEWAHDPLVSM